MDCSIGTGKPYGISLFIPGNGAGLAGIYNQDLVAGKGWVDIRFSFPLRIYTIFSITKFLEEPLFPEEWIVTFPKFYHTDLIHLGGGMEAGTKKMSISALGIMVWCALAAV